MQKINQRGQILIFVTLGFVMLGLFVGMAIDFGRGYLERARISRTVDAVALAAARALLGSSAPSYEAAAVAAGCGAASMNGVSSGSCGETAPLGPVSDPAPGDPVGCAAGLGAVNVAVCFVSKNVSGGGAMNFVQVSGRSSVPTTFLRLLTFVGAGDYTTLPVAAVAEGGPDRPVDLMLVLDRSGSMNCGTPCEDGTGTQKINALKCALVGTNCPAGVSTAGFLGQGFTDNDKIGMTSFSSRGCGNASGGNSTSGSDPCPADISLDFFNSSQKTNIINRVNGLNANGYTNTMEALRAAGPQMNAAFADTSRASRKAILLVTDGQPTALRLSSLSACDTDPGAYPSTGSALPDVTPSWSDSNGCWFRYLLGGSDSDSGLARNKLDGSSIPSSQANSTNAGLFQQLFSATRNAARDAAHQLRGLGGGTVIVFTIGIGKTTGGNPDGRLDANARCLLGLIANDPDVINDPSTNQQTGGCAGVYNTPWGGGVTDTHADLMSTTPGSTPRTVITGHMNGKFYTVDLSGDVTAQLQDIFGQIAAILKLRLTI